MCHPQVVGPALNRHTPMRHLYRVEKISSNPGSTQPILTGLITSMVSRDKKGRPHPAALYNAVK